MSAPMKIMFTSKILKNFSPILGGRYWQRCFCSAAGNSDTHTSRSESSLAQQFKQATLHQIVRPICRTSEQNPANHAEHHVGLFYSVPQEDFDQWLKLYPNPRFNRMCKAFTENCFMVRQPAVEIIRCMQLANYSMPAIRYLLYGRFGNGKSITQAHVAHYCGTQGWMHVHIPWGAYYNRYYKDSEYSTYKKGRVDQPLDAAEWLHYFRQMNDSLLKELNLLTVNRYVWSKRESLEIGVPILEGIEFGLARVKYASDIVGMVLKELRHQAATRGFKVLVAVDGVNAFWEGTKIKDESDRTGHTKHRSKELTMVHNFMKMLKNDWSSGAIVCTVDAMAGDLYESKSAYLPKMLLGQEGFEWLDPHIPIYVPDYTEKEAYSCIEYYMDRGWIQNAQARTEDGKKELLFLSGKSPNELYKVTAPL